MHKRNEFISAARELIDTPFVHQGRLPKSETCKGGLDCAGLGIVAARKAGINLQDMDGYDRKPDGKSLIAHLNKILEPIDIKEAIPGDILIMCFMINPQHVAILSEKNGRSTVIHASLQDKKVVEHNISDNWKKRIIRAYRIPGIE